MIKCYLVRLCLVILHITLSTRPRQDSSDIASQAAADISLLQPTVHESSIGKFSQIADPNDKENKTAKIKEDKRVPIKGSNWWRKCKPPENMRQCQNDKYCCCDEGFEWNGKTCRDKHWLDSMNVEAELQEQFQKDARVLADDAAETATKVGIISGVVAVMLGLGLGMGALSLYAKTVNEQRQQQQLSFCGSCLLYPRVAVAFVISIVLVMVGLQVYFLVTHVTGIVDAIEPEVIGVSISRFADSFLGNLERLEDAVDKDVRWELSVLNPTTEIVEISKMDGDVYLGTSTPLRVATIRSEETFVLQPEAQGSLGIRVRVSSVTAVASGLAAITASFVSGLFYVRPKLDLEGTFKERPFLAHVEAYVPFKVKDIERIPEDFQNDKMMTKSMINGLQKHNAQGKTLIDWRNSFVRSPASRMSIVIVSCLLVNFMLMVACATCCCCRERFGILDHVETHS